MVKKRYKQKKVLFFAGIILVIFSLAIAVLLFSLRYDRLWSWYGETRKILMELENKIVLLDKLWEFIIAIFLLYLIKSFVPIYCTSTVCFLTGVVLPLYLALPVNVIGLSIQFSVRYFSGRKLGAGSAWKLIRKIDWLKDIMLSGGTGNPALLTALRLIPSMPVNSVSSIYGSFDFGYTKFLILSLVGYLPKLISFTVVGRNMFDPLSSGFLVPFMIITLFTGLACLSANGMWNVVEWFIKIYSKKIKRGKL